ncbi:MAG: hypothetical protein F6J93_23815 [Oscillatoria sp. SIO1A7]|nr:hypothetical protein [Oscillatoria sp. SIO1A7]
MPYRNRVSGCSSRSLPVHYQLAMNWLHHQHPTLHPTPLTGFHPVSSSSG